MDIELLYFAEFKDITGKEKENFNLNNSNLIELIDQLFLKYNSIKKLIWDDQTNNLKKYVSIAVNGEMAKSKNKLLTELSDGDKIAFLLPISGGWENLKNKIVPQIKSGIYSKGSITLENIIKSIKSHHNIEDVGSILTFTGIVRKTSNNGKPVKGLKIDAYIEMANKSIEKICEEIRLFHSRR